MKIKKIKINNFGKLNNKEIELSNGINLIYGKNEAGKSTLLKFIPAMFYGVSRNKNGQMESDFDKYNPWNNNEFSGKLEYELDNNERFEIYREFVKKNPKIYDENLEEISKKYNIDKTKGSQFFYEQVGIEEDFFNSSVISKQTEVKLDEKTKNNLIQKILNILGTGEDSVSYSNIITKLRKKINEEIGTNNTKERPINILENEIKQLEYENSQINKCKENGKSIKYKINNIEQEINNKKEILSNYKKANQAKDELKYIEKNISVNNELLKNSEIIIDNERERLCSISRKKRKKISNIYHLILFIIFICAGTTYFLFRNLLLNIISLLAIISYLIYYLITIKKININNKKILHEKNECEDKIRIENSNKEKIQNSQNELKKEYETRILKIQNENNVDNMNTLLENIDIIKDEISRLEIDKLKLEFENKETINKVEKELDIKEKLFSLNEEKFELEHKRENIKRAMDYVEFAYNKVKEQITPKFTDELSSVMFKISNGKYKNIKMNISGEIIVETLLGEYINAEKLSVGTIEQIYLSLRLATIKQVSKENMPVILDETFAYYDDERLKNIIEYLNEEQKNRQIILFTCTNRERKILEELNINYNFIQL